MSYPQMEDKSINPTDTGAPNEANPPALDPPIEPAPAPRASDVATVPPVEPPAPPLPPPDPWIQAKRDLISRAVYYVLFDLAVYGFYLFAEAHGHWYLFFVFITAVMFAFEYKNKFRKYKNVKGEAPTAPAIETNRYQPDETTTPRDN